MIKITLPHKSGNLENLKKQLQQLESFSTNLPIVGEDLQRVLLFYLRFWDSSGNEKKPCTIGFTRNLRDFYMKIIVTIISAYLVANLLLFLFAPS